MPQFDIDKIASNKFNKILIDFGWGFGATFFIIDDMFSIGTESGFQDLYTGDMVKDTAGSIGGKAGEMLVTGLQNTLSAQTKNVWQTINTWTGSKKPQFSFSVLRIKMRPTDNIMTDGVAIQALCMPSSSNSVLGSTVLDSVMFNAPNGYNPLKEEGLCSLKVGEWFHARKLNLINAEFEYSREVSNDGSPLYCTGKISLEPYRMILAEEFADYFPQVSTQVKALINKRTK